MKSESRDREGGAPFRVLVADDEPDIRSVVVTYLELEGFIVYEAEDGRAACEQAVKHRPDLILMDVMMPRLSGTEALEELRRDFRTAFIPVVFLTARSMVGDKVGHLLAGADDYVVKPFDPSELVARVEVVLRRSRAMRGLNPLTGLPGNSVIIEEIARRLESGTPFACLYCDFDNFKAYNDKYGWARGDSVIREMSTCLLAALEACPSKERFAGHVGGDDFVVLVGSDYAEDLARDICARFDGIVPGHYDPADRERGWIQVKDRRGEEAQFPFVSVSIGIVDAENRDFQSPAEVAEVAAEVKSIAKRTEGSSYAVDRRRD